MKRKATPGSCCASAPTRPPSRADGKSLALLAKALAHPARIRILQLLIRRDTCIAGDIVGRLPLAQSTVSQHLKVLKDAGLIIGCEDGNRVCYCVDAAVVARFKDLVAAL
ncbi:MAG TPA: metalloregulator ArsR/SmtB family transcription factor [Planctomycetota bacterium]|nr:metalloregulator ArsR/SmtB family transcription factor [Planctomycetota bacterium]